MCAVGFTQRYVLRMSNNHNSEQPIHRKAYPKRGRVILHIDMNAFYCSVHEAEEPQKYRGKPCAVSGSVEQRKGIVVTSSYPARSRGVRTGMQVREALKVCPELILIRPSFNLYRHYSRRFLAICSDYSPLVEALSIDECFVDLTGCGQFGTPVEIAQEIQRRINKELKLPCSIGIAPNKLLAKMASDMKKPNGITILRKRDVPHKLWHEPCSVLYGVGHKTAQKLEGFGILTIGQLAAADEQELVERFGVNGTYLKRAANGEDDSQVKGKRAPNKSMGHMTTLPYDYTDRVEIDRVFLNLADQVTRRLRRQAKMAGTIQVTIRTPRMKTITRSATLNTPSADPDVIYEKARHLFKRHWEEGKPVRLLGLTAQNLVDRESAAVQLDLFDYKEEEMKDQLTETIDALRDKFGENAILKAGMIQNQTDSSHLLRDHNRRGTSLQMDWLGQEDDPEEK